MKRHSLWIHVHGYSCAFLQTLIVLSGSVWFDAAALAVEPQADAVRLKDLGRIQGARDNALMGYGIVTGLAGTGDSPTNRTTKQALANAFSQFNLTVSPDQVQSRNVAVVLVSASLSTLGRPGDTVDITVSSAGDARSLVGGTLLLTPLVGPDNKIHALAQGPVTVGGYRYDNNGNVVQKNHPTVGSIPGGASVELGVEGPSIGAMPVATVVLNDPDFTTAERVADAVNVQVGAGIAEARDASAIEVRMPDYSRAKPIAFLSRIENVLVDPDTRARVVINERTGTIVSGGNVRISKVAVSHGDLKVSVTAYTSVSQPMVIGSSLPGVRTIPITNTRMDIEEAGGQAFVADKNTVADLVQALSRLKINTRDIISVLLAIKAAGALHAELVVQ